MHERPPQTRMILHAAARVLGCGSAQLAIVDEERRALVFRIGVANRELPRLAAVESTLGFPLEGAMLPLSVEESLLVRALRQGRLIVAHEVSELAGGLLSREMAAAIQETIGPRSFAAVPITGRSGALGVLLFEKQGEDGFSGRDRELILDYAERVGANLESQALSDDARRLAALEAGAGAAPVLYSCDPALVVTTGAAPGRPLWEVLEVASGPLLE